MTEQTPGSLHDGNPATGAFFDANNRGGLGVLVCELDQKSDLREVCVTLRKATNWYLMKELEVAFDDGCGEFAHPKTVPVPVEKYNGRGPTVDASCTNMTFRVPVNERAVRVRVTVKTGAHGAITELVLSDGQPEAAAPAAAPAAAKKAKETLPDNLTVLENKYFKLRVTPLGGRVLSLRAKFLDNVEMTDARAKAGTFTEFDWSKRVNNCFYMNKPFQLRTSAKGGARVLEATGNAQGGGTDFLAIHKRYTLRDDATAIGVDYVFENIDAAMSPMDYSMMIHSTLGVSGRLCSYYYPTEDGIVEIPRDKRPQERYIHHPTRGWMAAVDDLGRGVALTMPFREVKSFYSWYAQDDVPTLEWRMIPVTIENGKSYAVPCEMIAFKGLGRVSGAGGGLVGELADGRARVYNSRAGTVTAKAGGQTVVLKFKKPGQVQSFETAATTVVLEKDGKEVCRLDAAPASGAWELKPLVASRESTVKAIDLTCYTNTPHQVCVPFAKPLAGRRPRVIALTGRGSIVEQGFLADRLDCELLTTTVIQSYYTDGSVPKKRSIKNPIYDSGDYFGVLSVSDIEENILKTLKKEADVILVGGLPWEIFPSSVQKAILAKVKAGCGLVWIGQDREAPEIFRRGASFKTVRGVPAAATAAFADVPFALFGSEPCYAFDDGASVVHARVGGAPYLTEDALGDGRVFNLSYRSIFGELNAISGLTPRFRDFIPNRAAPVEHYYSLIAKCLLKAAKIPAPASFGKASVDGNAAQLALTASAPGEATLAWTVRTRFGDALAAGTNRLALAKGANAVAVPLADVAPYAGPLAFEAVVRDAAGRVLTWGAWSFEKAPGAKLAEFVADRDASKGGAYREGETAAVRARLDGAADGREVRLSLADYLGRVLAEETHPAAENVRASFVLTDDLPSWMYEATARLVENGREIDRLRVELRARPEPAKWPWDDFHFGVWLFELTPEHLWPELAKLYRDMRLTTNIANPWNLSVNFPMRHGFEPTLLAGAGLGRCSEPAAYLQTGDKTKLVRPPCLSDPAFYAKQERSLSSVARRIANLGLRYVWYGDEQSLTGYGGKPIDFCFSEHCLREFRAFLKERYGSLEALNAAWATTFAAWDDVLPFTRQEVWAEGGEAHVAGWADHIEFMDGRVEKSLGFARDLLHRGDENVGAFLSGTQAPTAYGGMDYWRQLGVLDGTIGYMVGGQLELNRSFRPDGRFAPFNWGYAGRNAVNQLWRTLFAGCQGIMGFCDRSIINPDWSWSKGYADVRPAMLRIDDGVGKHFLNNLPAKPQVAILYSQASIRAAFYENRAEEHEQLRWKYIEMLYHLGHAYDFVSYAQLADGTFEKRPYKALILADASAMSDAEVAAVRRFAAKGGAVFAEGVAARREGNCRRRAVSPLAAFTVVEKPSAAYMKAIQYPNEPANAKLIASEQDRLDAFLRKAGVASPRLTITDAADGSRIRTAELFVREGRGAVAWGVLPDNATAKTATFKFSRKGYVYELTTGRALGYGDTFTLPLAKTRPYAFELCAEKPALGEVSADGETVAVAYAPSVDTVVRLRVFAPSGEEAGHYAKKLVVKGGRATHRVPFALSDAKGVWKVVAEDVLTGEKKSIEIRR